MTRIRIDLAAPIACTAQPDELADRRDQLERLRSRLRGIVRTEQGLVLTFPPDPGLRADLERFAVEEKGCCTFWGFEVVETPVDLTLRWDGPPTVAPIFDELHEAFRGGDPFTALSGLL